MRTEGHVGQREDVQRVRRGRRLDVDNMRRVERSEGLRTLTRKQAVGGSQRVRENMGLGGDGRGKDAVFGRVGADDAVVVGEV